MTLLTFRLDPDRGQRLRARLAADRRTMSAVITDGLRQYVAIGPGADGPHAEGRPGEGRSGEGRSGEGRPVEGRSPEGRPGLPEHTAARLRELRTSGRSGVLSATLAALHADGWPLAALADALGVSRQAIAVRVRQRVPAELRDRAADCPPPVYPRRRSPHEGRLRRPHLTIKIDGGLRAAAHRAAAGEGRSLSQVVEAILDHYLASSPSDPDVPNDGPATPAQAPASRRARRSR